MIATIATREFKTLFLSPIAWSILAVLQFILAYLFLKQVETLWCCSLNSRKSPTALA